MIDPVTGQKEGGDNMIQGNLELIFPILPSAGFKGVLFFDTGNVWNNGTSMDTGSFKKTAGVGVRWYSPMGPLRLEWGWNINPQPGEDSNNWEFSIGSFF